MPTLATSPTSMPKPSRARKVQCPVCGQPRETGNGSYLRWRRTRAGISLREMARRLRLSAAYLSDIELNRRHVTERVSRAYMRLKPWAGAN